MEKVIDINGEKVNFKTHGAIPILYAQKYGKDFFSTIMKMEELINSEGSVNGDLLPIYEIAHLFAKTADKEIPDDMVEWLSMFEDGFPVIEVFVELQDLILSNMQSLKKKSKKW